MTFLLGAAVRPKLGNAVAGDAWVHCGNEQRTLIAVCDGLGSGEPARAAADACVETIQASDHDGLGPLFASCHTALLGTRGAAAGVLWLDHEANTVSYAGVGNIEVRTRPEWQFRPMSLRGIVGANQYREPRIYTAPYAPSEWLVLHSDGLRSRFNLEYEVMRAAQGHAPEDCPGAVARALLEDHGVTDDDVTVVVVRLC